MKGIERNYCNVCIRAVIAAWEALEETFPKRLLEYTKYGKNDTLVLDATPEIVICDMLKEHDDHSLIITEESAQHLKSRWPLDSDPVKLPIMFFSDPTDGSENLAKFYGEVSRRCPAETMHQSLKSVDRIALWEEMIGSPASVTGSTSSLTCIRKGEIIFSVILNYITETITIAVPSGVFYLDLSRISKKTLQKIDCDFIAENGKILSFPPASKTCKTHNDFKRCVTFLGKTGYLDNFRDSLIVENPDDIEKFVHYDKPVGPSRIFYLSDWQRGHGPIGYILSNGEKITEWIHWLAFVKFAKQSRSNGDSLKVFEIVTERAWFKDSVLMSTASPYSIFNDLDGKGFLDISRLKVYPNPGRFRSMLVVTTTDNKIIVPILRRHDYREVTDFF